MRKLGTAGSMPVIAICVGTLKSVVDAEALTWNATYDLPLCTNDSGDAMNGVAGGAVTVLMRVHVLAPSPLSISRWTSSRARSATVNSTQSLPNSGARQANAYSLNDASDVIGVSTPVVRSSQ